MAVIMGIDLGSRRCGCVAATEALPLHVHIADVVQVPPFVSGGAAGGGRERVWRWRGRRGRYA